MVPRPRFSINGQTLAAVLNRPKVAKTPAQFEHFVAGVRERPVADLCPKVVDHHLDRADIRFDRGDPLFDRSGRHGVQQEA